MTRVEQTAALYTDYIRTLELVKPAILEAARKLDAATVKHLKESKCVVRNAATDAEFGNISFDIYCKGDERIFRDCCVYVSIYNVCGTFCQSFQTTIEEVSSSERFDYSLFAAQVEKELCEYKELVGFFNALASDEVAEQVRKANEALKNLIDILPDNRQSLSWLSINRFATDDNYISIK